MFPLLFSSCGYESPKLLTIDRGSFHTHARVACRNLLLCTGEFCVQVVIGEALLLVICSGCGKCVMTTGNFIHHHECSAA